MPFKTDSYSMGNTIIKPTNIGTNSWLSHIRASIIMAIVGIELKKLSTGTIKLYINLEKKESIPRPMANTRENKNPNRPLSRE